MLVKINGNCGTFTRLSFMQMKIIIIINKTQALHWIPHSEVGVNWSLNITMLNTFHLFLPQIAGELRSRVTLLFEIWLRKGTKNQVRFGLWIAYPCGGRASELRSRLAAGCSKHGKTTSKITPKHCSGVPRRNYFTTALQRPMYLTEILRCSDIY